MEKPKRVYKRKPGPPKKLTGEFAATTVRVDPAKLSWAIENHPGGFNALVRDCLDAAYNAAHPPQS